MEKSVSEHVTVTTRRKGSHHQFGIGRASKSLLTQQTQQRHLLIRGRASDPELLAALDIDRRITGSQMLNRDGYFAATSRHQWQHSFT